MTGSEYRQDDELGRGYCPRCHCVIVLDTALYGFCEKHGKVAADFTRPADDDAVEGHRVQP